MFNGDRLPVKARQALPVADGTCDTILNHLWPGDVILKWTDGSPVARIINFVQSNYGYPPKSPQITHVSMYTGHNEVFHATYSPINAKKSQARFQSFLEYYSGHRISIARPFFGAGRYATVRERLVDECRNVEGAPYDMAFLAKVELENLKAFFSSASPEELSAVQDNLRDGHICSTVLFQVFHRISGANSPLNPRGICDTGPYIMPADFFVSPELHPITIVR